jgi:hypothetical protein
MYRDQEPKRKYIPEEKIMVPNIDGAGSEKNKFSK